MSFAKSRRWRYGETPVGGCNPGCAPRAQQVAAIRRGKGMSRQTLPDSARLRFACRIEVDVDVSLDALFAIPVCFTMPDEAEAGGVC